MPEEQDTPKQPLNEELTANAIVQDSTISPSETKTLDMEVHHHPDLLHKPKKWKEYLIEFLMIFLAVTLGFFAENIREHFAETEKAKEYAKSLYDDLKLDSAIIERTYKEKEWVIVKFDSALKILDSKELDRFNEFIYYVERYTVFKDVFTSQDVTYQQLRSSGNFRYIKNISLYKEIADYYNLYIRYQSLDGSFGNSGLSETSELESKLFDPKDLASLYNNNGTSFYDLVLRPTAEFAAIPKDYHELKLLHIRIDNARHTSRDSQVLFRMLERDGLAIMNDLKKEYHFEN
jgi:hypothetical protein